jgi:ABC-type transport system involved in multi-copper enzyme maturation permease subunit
MTFLPIVQRELRVAARKPSTWWVRLATSALAIFACGSFLFITLFGAPPQDLGETLFTMLAWYSFGLCLLAGVFVTADCLSEEKREGTLGLLFLTDLRGHDVVLGKFLARSLNAFYSLFALLPVMSVTLLMGGVTGAEFARVSLALVNALFVALAAGMFVSAYSREYREATGRTVVLLALLVGGLPLASGILQMLPLPGLDWSLLVAMPSPSTAFHTAFDSAWFMRGFLYWQSLVVSHLLGWAMLAWTSVRLPKLWQVSVSAATSAKTWKDRVPLLRPRLRKESFAHRAPSLDANPILWLNQRFAGGRTLVWLLAIAACLPWVLAAVLGGGFEIYFTFGFVTKPVLFTMKLLVAIEACRFFAEARRTGAIELLLASPLTNDQIRQGQWTALRRFFVPPMCLVLLLTLGSIAAATLKAFFNEGFLQDDWEDFFGMFFLGSTTIYPMLKLVADLFAVCYVGLWLSIRGRKPEHAAGLTILYVLVLPIVAFPVPDVLIDACLIAWAKGNLDGDIRWHIRRHFEPPVKIKRGSARPPRLPPPLPVTNQGSSSGPSSS